MLGLNMEVEIDIKKPKFPVYFKNKNICIHCGAVSSLIFVNGFGRATNKKSIDAFDHMKCTNCNRIYSILWEADENNELKPSAVEYNIGREFSNFMNSYIKEHGNKSLKN